MELEDTGVKYATNSIYLNTGDGEKGQTSNEVAEYIYQVFGDSGDVGYFLARCESTLNPMAVSPSGKYHGLYQYDFPTWNENCTGDIYNYRSQIECTKKLIDKGESGRWPTCY